MIVGTIALITLLFFGGGVPDYFLVTGLEKGVKEYVIEKERKKEILAEFKIAKKKSKTIYKSRSELIKELKILNADRLATTADFQKYETLLLENTVEYQDLVIDSRLDLIKNITEDEWANIIEYSKNVVNKENKKLQKKIDDGKIKDPFKDLESKINTQILDEKNRGIVMEALTTFKNDFKVFAKKLNKRNVNDTPVLMHKNSSNEDLKKIAAEVNSIRMDTYKSMLDFRTVLLENTTEEEWNKTIKIFNKLWN